MKLDIAKLLIEHGAIVDVPNNNGDTPLMEASYMCSDTPQPVSLLLKYGANIHHKNHMGWSALMKAVFMQNIRCISVLLKEGVDVEITTTFMGRPISLLSALLNKWYVDRTSQEMALVLLQHGASVKYVRNDAIHRLIAVGSGELVQMLIHGGLIPIDIVMTENVFHWPMLTLSPLTVCLVRNRWKLAQDFIDNWFLTKSDVKVLSRNMQIMNYLERWDSFRGSVCGNRLLKIIYYLNIFDRKCGFAIARLLLDYIISPNRMNTIRGPNVGHKFMKVWSWLEDIPASNVAQNLMKISAQPLRLVLLSFIVVSTAVGAGPDRADRVHKLCLPDAMKDRLMFRDLKVTQLVESVDDAGFSFNCDMSKRQVYDEVPDELYNRRD